MKISLIDYGAGNLPSVERALHRLAVPTERVDSPEGLANASALILPGVGHYAALIRALDKNGLREALIDAIARGIPFLGICLGLQALYQMSEEAPELQGLKIFSRLRARPDGKREVAAHGLESGASQERIAAAGRN